MSDGKRDYKLGKRHGIRWAITWLHRRAREMNDPRARDVLNTAGFHLGVDAKDAHLIRLDDKIDQ